MYDYILALLGGAMIGMAAVMLMATHGKILGVSGIVSQLLPPFSTNENLSLIHISEPTNS